MTGLLVSVRSVAETLRAIDGGAEIIDIKEPRNGSLGAARPPRWTEVIQACRDRRPVSIALGELVDPELPALLSQLPPVRFAKVGLAACRKRDDWLPRWRWAIKQLPSSTVPVAVVYADALAAQAPDAADIIASAKRLSCGALLWDTWEKRHGNLFSHVPLSQLQQQLQEASGMGLLTVLAGSLSLNDLATIGQLQPDYVAVRGAVCAGARTGSIRRAHVACFARAVQDISSAPQTRERLID